MSGQHLRGWNDKRVDKGEIRWKLKGGIREMEDYEEVREKGGGEGEKIKGGRRKIEDYEERKERR